MSWKTKSAIFVAISSFVVFANIQDAKQKAAVEALKTPAQRREEAATKAAEKLEEARVLGCNVDFKKCRDNEDIANHNYDYYDAKNACRHAADEQAKYGTPEWPWFSFGRFRTGNSALVTGDIVLIDNDVKFQNGFGAMAHVKVTCTYNFSTKHVIAEIEQP